MANEKTYEYVKEVVDEVFGTDRGIAFRYGDGTVTVETADWMAELTKRMENVERKSFGGTRIVPMAKYDIATYSYDPGVWMYPDGSGQPPSWDEEDEGTFDSLIEAIKWIVSSIAMRSAENRMFAKSLAEENDEYFDVEAFDEHGEYVGE